MWKYVLFDLDGTVVDSSEGITKSVMQALEKEKIYEKPENLRKFIGPSLRVSFGWYTSDAVQCERMLANYRARYSTIGLKEVKLYDGMRQLFISLREAGKKVILASAKPEKFCIEILQYLGVYDLFDFVGGADFEGKRDDKAVLIKYVLDNIGNPPPEECVMIGDRFYDMDGGHKNGIVGIGVKFGFSEADELEKAGAEYVVETVDALGDLLLKN